MNKEQAIAAKDQGIRVNIVLRDGDLLTYHDRDEPVVCKITMVETAYRARGGGKARMVDAETGAPWFKLEEVGDLVEVSNPKPVKVDVGFARIMDYYASEEEADAAAAEVVKRGDTYSSGYFVGMPCGRESSRDYFDKNLGQKLHAVSRDQ